MTRTTTIKIIALGTFAAGALAFFAQASGVAHAEESINIGIGELQECTISKSMDSTVDSGDLLVWQDQFGSTGDFGGDGDTDGSDFLMWQRTSAAGDYDRDGDVDGRDFLIWQRNPSMTPLSAGNLADWQANYGIGS